MKLEEFSQLFKKHECESFKFAAIEVKRSNRPDLHAFMLLDILQPSNQKIVACAEHDQIWLSTDVYKLIETITEDQVVELIRCRICFDKSNENLFMFV